MHFAVTIHKVVYMSNLSEIDEMRLPGKARILQITALKLAVCFQNAEVEKMKISSLYFRLCMSGEGGSFLSVIDPKLKVPFNFRLQSFHSRFIKMNLTKCPFQGADLGRSFKAELPSDSKICDTTKEKMATKAAFIRKPDLQSTEMTIMTNITYFGNIFVSTRKHSVSKLNLKRKKKTLMLSQLDLVLFAFPLGYINFI